MNTQHEEFPEMTQQAQAAYRAGCRAVPFSPTLITNIDRRYLAAFLREAMEQARYRFDSSLWQELQAIANNLHSPPQPPPTLAEARKADMDTPAGKATVTAFLASLGEGVQP
jgi:hypothetical protein